MRRVDYQSLEQAQPEDAATPEPDVTSRIRQLMVIALIVALGAVTLRVFTLREDMQRMTANPTVLPIVCSSASAVGSGRPISHLRQFRLGSVSTTRCNPGRSSPP